MTKAKLTLASSVLLVLGCAAALSASRHLILNTELANAYENVDASLSQERTPLSFSGGAGASDCNGYLTLRTRYGVEETVSNQLIRGEYLVCDALNILARAEPARAVGPEPGKTLLSRLDLRSFPSSLRPAATDAAYTLATMFPTQISSSRNIAQLDTGDWMLSLELVAAARINDNAIPDWIVWMADEAKSGNYRSYQTLVIYDPERPGMLTAIMSR